MDHLVELSCLAADLVFLGVFYKIFKDKSKSVKSVANAKEFELDKTLKATLTKTKNGTISYALVRGVVFATYKPIPSHYVEGIAGVIQESSVIEHKVQWNPFSRIWSEITDQVQSFSNSVPFHLTNSSYWNKVVVTVHDPLAAKELPLSTVYNQFTPRNDSLSEYVWSWFRGEQLKGFQTKEMMLVQGTTLTAIGELLMENGQIVIRPPGNADYYLTSLTREALLKKLEKEAHSYRAITAVCAFIGIYIAAQIGSSWYRKYRFEKKARLNHTRREKEKNERRIKERNRSMEDGTSPMATPICVVCLTNPVEVLVMDCGHVCLCLDCSERVNACPICRNNIAQTVAAFLP